MKTRAFTAAYLLLLASIAVLGLYMHAHHEPVWSGALIGAWMAVVTYWALRFAYQLGERHAYLDAAAQLKELRADLVLLERIQGPS